MLFPKVETKNNAGYPLEISPEELKILRAQKIINITAYVHFALRWESQNYAGQSIHISAFAKRWNISRSSTYRALEILERRGWMKRSPPCGAQASRKRDFPFCFSEEFYVDGF